MMHLGQSQAGGGPGVGCPLQQLANWQQSWLVKECGGLVYMYVPLSI